MADFISLVLFWKLLLLVCLCRPFYRHSDFFNSWYTSMLKDIEESCRSFLFIFACGPWIPWKFKSDLYRRHAKRSRNKSGSIQSSFDRQKISLGFHRMGNEHLHPEPRFSERGLPGFQGRAYTHRTARAPMSRGSRLNLHPPPPPWMEHRIDYRAL
jgi:hypothetical protein